MSAAAKVEIYVSKRPYLKEALAEGIVNYSALARKICREEDVSSMEAVKAALSRLEKHIGDLRVQRRDRVVEVLEGTRIRLEDGVGVEKTESAEDSLVRARTESGYTNILPEGKKSMITLVSPEELEETPGVVEFMMSSLAAEGINVDQLISCREDTHIVIDQKDASRALELLQERLSV